MPAKKPRIGLVTLGCDKNTVDMEHVAGALARRGCEVRVAPMDPDECRQDFDAVVVLTCGFIADAKIQSVESLVAWAERKKETGRPARLYAAGCLVQRHPGELQKELPEVDGWVGVGQVADLVASVTRPPAGEGCTALVRARPSMDEVPAQPRLRLESGPAAWLKIADGCNHRCAFCAIPAIKGPFASLPREFVLGEARSLVRQGVRELNLIAQDITAYGNDLYPDYRLPELLRDLCAVPGDFRVRCLYAYPGGITDRLLDVMAGEGKVVPYLDIPLQHLVPEMLKKMRRPSATLGTARLLSRIRKRLPGAVLRTTLIAGFPGETREIFREAVSLLKEYRFHWLGVFAYSPEEGTPAERFPDLPTESTRERRRLRLLEAQAAVTAELNAARVGAVERLLVEHREPESGLWQCRGPFEAPEVDGTIWLSAAPGAVAAGDFVDARITASGIYDVFASPLPEG